MDSEKLVYYRKRLGLTQKLLAQLMATSLKAIHSYEQGWRNIPDYVERQLYFLVSRQITGKGGRHPCWVQKKCSPVKKKQCPAWKTKTGHLCWFINGTICEGQAHKTWSEKIEICKNCRVFKPISDF